MKGAVRKMPKDPVFLKQVKFVPLQIEHVNQITAIEQEAFTTPWSENSFAYEIKSNKFARYLVALLSEKEVAGYAGMWLILDEAHVTNIAVHRKYRGRGLGKELMRKLIVWAAIEGATTMTLEVRPSNTPARSLYASLGFREKGIRKKYYSDTGENAIIMWKENLP